MNKKSTEIVTVTLQVQNVSFYGFIDILRKENSVSHLQYILQKNFDNNRLIS